MANTAKDFKDLAERMELAESFASFGSWKFNFTSRTAYCSDLVFTKILEIPIPGDNTIAIRDLISYTHPDDTARIQVIFEAGPVIGKAIEYRMVIGGRIKYVYNKAILKKTDAQGDVIVEGYIQDITDMIFERHELLSLKHAVDLMDEEVYAFTAEGDMYYANSQVRDRYQLQKNGLYYNLDQINPYFTREKLLELLAKADDQAGYRFSTEHILPGGSKIPVMITLHKALGSDGKMQIWAYGRDMSVDKQQKHKIDHLNRLIDTILQDAPLAIYVKDGVNFRHVYWNQASERITGVPRSKALGSTDYDIFPDRKEADQMRQTDMALVKKGGRVEYLSNIRMPSGGVRTMRTIKTVMQDPGAAPFIVAVSIDISESKNAEQELIKARLAAEKSNKLKTALVSNFSHDVRTSLNDIAGFAQVIAQEPDAAKRSSYSAIIEKSIAKLLEEVGYVVDVSNIDAGKIEVDNHVFNVRKMCLDALPGLRAAMPAGVTLTFDEASADISVDSDSKRIGQVLTNVVNLAAKYVPEGEVKFGYRYAGGKLEFYVEDNGSGLASFDLDMLLQQYSSHDGYLREHEDGLKLILCKMVVEMMGGALELSSVPDKGSEFRFSVTCRFEGMSTPAPVPQTSGASADKPKHEGMKNVLVAEDVDSNYQLLQALVGKFYNLRRAVNGRVAVDMYRQSQDQTDLILMDMKMPEMNGLEATREIRTFAPDVPIVALTANAFNDDRVAALDAGCTDFLTKPISADLLRKTIEKYT